MPKAETSQGSRRVSQSSPSRILPIAGEMEYTLADLDAIYRDPQDVQQQNIEVDNLLELQDNNNDEEMKEIDNSIPSQAMLFSSMQDEAMLDCDDSPPSLVIDLDMIDDYDDYNKEKEDP